MADRGDPEHDRFKAVYDQHYPAVLRYAARRVGAEAARDIAAETFLTAWRRLDDVPSGDVARLWLYGVARRTLANHHRGERRRSALADRLRADLAAAGQPPPFTGERADVVQAFRCLPEADRELLALAGWEGLDAGQIAATFGCSRNAARIRLHRARRRFAAELARERVRPLPAPVHAAKGDLA